MEAAAKAGIEFVELPVAFDGLTIVVNPKNSWCSSLTVEQVTKIYSATGGVKTWKDLDPSWPDKTIKVYSPGTDSGDSGASATANAVAEDCAFDSGSEGEVGVEDGAGHLKAANAAEEQPSTIGSRVLFKSAIGDVDGVVVAVPRVVRAAALLRAVADEGAA